MKTKGWKSTCLLYKSLDIYRETVFNIGNHIWWKIASKVPNFTRNISGVMSVLMNSQPRGMFCKSIGKMCAICESNVVDSAKHVLFECKRLETPRKIYMSKLYNSMPPALVISFRESNNREKTYLLLSAYRSRFPIDEWLNLYCETSSYVYHMYKSRKESHTQMYGITN